jgi:hypothetical protein
MNKILSGVAMIASTLAVSFAANAADVSSYYSTLHPKASKTLSVPPTNITVLNYSEEAIFAIVPGTPINDMLRAGKSDTISHDTYYGDTRLVLQDWNRYTMYDQYVCRRAIVTVDGRPGYYRISVDRKYC